MTSRDNHTLRKIELTLDEELEYLFDMLDVVNHNFVLEVECSIAHSGNPPQLTRLH